MLCFTALTAALLPSEATSRLGLGMRRVLDTLHAESNDNPCAPLDHAQKHSPRAARLLHSATVEHTLTPLLESIQELHKATVGIHTGTCCKVA